MCIPIKKSFQARRKTQADRKAAKLALNDYRRTHEGLLLIALEQPNSTNSLTQRDPSRAAIERKEGNGDFMKKRD